MAPPFDNRGSMTLPEDVTGVILVGGRSSRMGRDKALLPLGGKSLFDKALSTLKSGLRDVLLVGDRPERFEKHGLKVIPDIYPGSALGGLYTGLLQAETPYVFASACDLPFSSPRILRYMMSIRDGFDVVVPLSGIHPEPLFALYHKNCLHSMVRMLEAENYRIRELYPHVRVRFVPGEELAGIDNDARVFTNVNTVEEYEALPKEEKP